MLKITLFGSESTGKTTLAAQLAAHYQTVWVPEYSRIYQEKHRRPLTFQDVTPIAKGQLRLEKQYPCLTGRQVSKSPNLLICDTDVLETKVYSEAYYGKTPAWLLRELPWHYADFYLLTNIDLPWQPDGIRDRPDDREAMHQRFKTELTSRTLAFQEISGSEPERLRQAIRALEKWLPQATTKTPQV